MEKTHHSHEFRKREICLRLIKDTFLRQAKLSKHLTNILTSHISTGSQLIVGSERIRETLLSFFFKLFLPFVSYCLLSCSIS